jgi:PAS domain S-box-containing protein
MGRGRSLKGVFDFGQPATALPKVEMSRFLVLEHKQPIRAMVLRYRIAVASVISASIAVFILRHFQVRDPFASIFLAAIAVSVWYGGTGPGLVAIGLSTLALHGFVSVPGGWLRIKVHEVPFFCVFLLFGLLIYRFSRSRRYVEQSLERARNQLEADVQSRTGELMRLNTEYKTILDAAPFGIALFGPNRVVRRCNPAYEKMLGFEAGEIIGQSAPLPESEKETWKVLEEQLRMGRGFVNYEGRRLRRNGSEFPATISGTPLSAGDGRYIGTVGVIIDNTERHEREIERQMLTAMVQHSPDFVGVADLNGAAVFVNRAGQALFGLDGDEHVRRTNVLEYFAEQERSRAQNELIPNLIRRRQLEFETLGRDFRTGKNFPLHCNCFVIPDPKTGAPAYIASVARDITERKQAEEALRRLQEHLRKENISLREQNLLLKQEFHHGEMFKEIIGCSPALERTLAMVEKVALTDSTVLITGETGTGKERIAHAIHMASQRADKPFISFNCAAFAPSLIASELFGHEKGAFTGAEQQRPGHFELAESGTIFLDEVGDIPAETQVALLRVLQEREFQRIGGNKPIRADVRVLAATNRDLHAAIERGSFRNDLFYRLNVFPIEVPPLRERREDIPLLVWHFVQLYARKLGKQIPKIEQRTMEALQSYQWPGNVRQLQNVIETAMVVSEGDILTVDERWLPPTADRTERAELPFLHMPLAESMLDYEKKRIEYALTVCAGQVGGASGAAVLLGMPPSTLRSRMKALQINPHLFKIDGRSSREPG